MLPFNEDVVIKRYVYAIINQDFWRGGEDINLLNVVGF
jgi:predicted transcriptional regulator